MSCPTVIRVSTKTGPPGIGLPAGSAQQNGFAIVKDGATPYLYKLVEISQIGLPQAIGITASPTFAGLTLSGLQAQAQGLAIVGINGQIQRVSIGSGLAIQNGALVVTVSSGGSGTVTSVGLSAPTGFSVSNSPVTGSGVLSFSFADGYSLLTTAKQQQWDAAAVLVATAVQGDDARLTNSREWSADTISQAEAEEGSSATRRAFNSLRARQGVLAWWQSTSGSVGKLLAAASTQVDARAALGLGTAATSAASDFATPSALATGLAGKADLIGGVIPSSQIPSIAITDYLGAVNSQSAMLALNGQKGDWCIRTDGLPNTGAWILSGNNPGSLSDWVKIPLPDVPVQSVNGQAGNIVLSPGDIGAATAAQGAKADSAIQPGNPALSDAREWNAATIDEAEATAGTATTRRAFSALRVRQGILGWWNNSSDKTKLDGIASGATANASDADLRDRSTHSGVQAISTITGLQAALNAVPAANTLNANVQQVFSLSGQEIGAVAQTAPRIVVWNTTTSRLEFSPTITLPAQVVTPATPSSGFTVYADNNGRFSWVGTNGFSRTFDATGITAPRVWVPPDRSGTLALTEEYTAHIFGTDTENLAVGRVRLLARAWQETTQFVSLPLWELVTAPSGASAVFDIRVNGTSIYSTLPSIASGSTSSSANPGVFSTAFNTANRTITSGSLVEVWCTQTGVSPNLGAGLRSQWYTQRVG